MSILTFQKPPGVMKIRPLPLPEVQLNQMSLTPYYIKILSKSTGKKVDVNLDNLMEHISELLKLRAEEMLRNKKASNPSNYPWPDVPGFKKLNAILSWGTDLKNFKELLSSALDFASKLKDVISGPVTTFLKGTGLLVVAYTLERFDYLSTNKEKC